MAIAQAEICICNRCGHRWLAEQMPPKRCGKCKSPAWNRGGAELREFIEVKLYGAPIPRDKMPAPQSIPRFKFCEHGAAAGLCKRGCK